MPWVTFIESQLGNTVNTYMGYAFYYEGAVRQENEKDEIFMDLLCKKVVNRISWYFDCVLFILQFGSYRKDGLHQVSRCRKEGHPESHIIMLTIVLYNIFSF